MWPAALQSASSARCSWVKPPDAGCSRWWTGPNRRTPIRACDWSVRPKRSCGRWWSSATARTGSGNWPPSTSLPSGSKIVDYWHVTEHVWTVARALFGADPDAAGVWAEAWCVDLLEHGPEPWLAALRSAEPPDSAGAEVVRVERGYFTTNAPRMDYPTFRARGLPIGSGAVESAAKHVVQVRMKRSGMRWSDAGGQALLALCAYRASNRPLLLPGSVPLAA